MTSGDMKFDEQVFDVKMATEYLEMKSEFRSTKAHQSKNVVIEYDDYNNKILSISDLIEPYSLNLINKLTVKLKLIDLAQRITKNTDLFCQLEYLIRKIPIDETRNTELKLVTQNLIYQSMYEDVDRVGISEIYMNAASPLSLLGCIAQSYSEVRVVSTKEMAVVCTLFVDLCRESGFNTSLLLVTTPEPPISTTALSLSFKEPSNCSVGIVTENADIDSAVDAFLYSTSRYPWRISKIYVQECVLSRFKRSFEWKTKKLSEGEHYVRQCTSALVYEDKIYLFEFAGNESELSDEAIVIEAYRTNKELISLMSGKRPFCVSLWSSNVAGSNEIAFAIDSNTIWINGFGSFDGPPAASQGYYSLIHSIPDEKYGRYIPKIYKDKILKLKNLWIKSDVLTRYQKVLEASQQFLASLEDSTEEIKLKMTNNSTIDVGKNVCVSIRKPVDVHLVYVKTYRDMFKCMNYVIEGGAVLFVVEHSFDDNKIAAYCKLLSDNNAPVGCVKFDTKNDLYFFNKLRYNTKVVWSSIGTIFAN